MSNIVVLGGTSGFGQRIANALRNAGANTHEGNLVLATGRRNGYDLNDGYWLSALRDSMDTLWGGAKNLDALVMAAYDRRFEQSNIQLHACMRLYQVLRDKEVRFCVIGDLAHHYNPHESLYTSNKRALYNQVLDWGRDPERQCSLFLYEPWEVNLEDQALESFITGMTGLGTGEFQIRTQRT